MYPSPCLSTRLNCRLSSAILSGDSSSVGTAYFFEFYVRVTTTLSFSFSETDLEFSPTSKCTSLWPAGSSSSVSDWSKWRLVCGFSSLGKGASLVAWEPAFSVKLKPLSWFCISGEGPAYLTTLPFW